MSSFNANAKQTQGMLTRSKARENDQNQNKRKRRENEETVIVKSKRRTEPDNGPSPIKMGNIIEKVLGFLDVKSIKATRQVNKLWSVEGAKILFTKCYVRIPSDLQAVESSTENETMINFKAFLSYKSSDVSMIPKITVSTATDFELWKSLGVLGPQVNSVKLAKTDNKVELLKKLLDLLPNLKYLNLDLKEYWFKGIDIMKILTSGMNNPERNGSLLVISCMSLYPDSVKDFEDLEEMSEYSNIKIEELRYQKKIAISSIVPQYAARQADIVTKFLSTNQNMLNKMTLYFVENCLPLILFPRMTHLTTLKLSFFSATLNAVSQCRFSPCFRFSEKVPNLEHVILHCKYMYMGAEDYFESLFKNTGTALSVKHLTYIPGPVDLSMDLLFQTFPNIKYLYLRLFGNGNGAFYSIFKNERNFKTLEIYVYLDIHPGDVADLDSYLTGFAPDTVDWLKNVPKGARWVIDDVEALRVNPSILDLAKLQVLKIKFTGAGRNFLPERTLAIAGNYAFKLMPKGSKVCITVKDKAPSIERARTSLDQVSKLPNVTVEFLEVV